MSTHALTDAGPAAAPSRRMRVLVVHNTYQLRGGEDAAVEREVAALARAGLTVETVLMDNDAIRSPLDAARAAWQAPRAPEGVARVMAAVRRFGPDVVHVHNTFPLISPAVHPAARAAGAATVQTLHNFRVTCASAQLMRDGHPCEDCVGGSPYNAVLHACYRRSRLGSLAVARMIDHHRRAGTWTRHVDRFIALSGFARSRFVAAGLPAARIAVKPNGLRDPGTDRTLPRAGLLYVGRLSDEKGAGVLARAAPQLHGPLEVIGEGPLAAAFAGAPAVAMRGPQDGDAVAAAMARALAVVVPSTCYENMPMVIAEAFAAGTPVVASRIGSLAGLVEDGVTGLHARPGDPADLAAACNRLLGDPALAVRLGAAARAVYEGAWTEAATTAALLRVYAEAVAARASEAIR